MLNHSEHNLSYVLVITGSDRKGIVSAGTRIDVLVESARQRQPFTHFLSFPVIAKGMKDRFAEFKDDVLRFCEGVCTVMLLQNFSVILSHSISFS